MDPVLWLVSAYGAISVMQCVLISRLVRQGDKALAALASAIWCKLSTLMWIALALWYFQEVWMKAVSGIFATVCLLSGVLFIARWRRRRRLVIVLES